MSPVSRASGYQGRASEPIRRGNETKVGREVFEFTLNRPDGSEGIIQPSRSYDDRCCFLMNAEHLGKRLLGVEYRMIQRAETIQPRLDICVHCRRKGCDGDEGRAGQDQS